MHHKLTGNNNGLEQPVIEAILDQLDAGRSIRHIANDLEVAKNTVQKYKGLRDMILARYGATKRLPDGVLKNSKSEKEE